LLPAAFFSYPLSGNWSGGCKMATALATCAFNPAVRTFRRNQALNLLTVLVRNKNLEGATAELLADKGELAALHGQIVTELSQGDQCGGGAPRFQVELLTLLAALHERQAEACSNDVSKAKQALEAYRQGVPKNRNFQEIKRAFNKAALALQAEVITASEKKKAKKR